MSIIIEKFSAIVFSVIVIIVGLGIALIYYGILSLQHLIALTLLILGILVIFRGLRERDKDEKKFYFMWGFIMIILTLSILTHSLTGLIPSLAVFFIGLGIIVFYLTIYSRETSTTIHPKTQSIYVSLNKN